MNKRQRDKFEKKLKIKTFKRVRDEVHHHFNYGILWNAKNKKFHFTREKLHREFMTNVHIYADDEEMLNKLRDSYMKLVETYDTIPNKFLGCCVYRVRHKVRPVKR